MILYREMTPEQRRRDDRAHQRMLKNIKEDAELTMGWYDSLDPKTRAELRESDDFG